MREMPRDRTIRRIMLQVAASAIVRMMRNETIRTGCHRAATKKPAISV